MKNIKKKFRIENTKRKFLVDLIDIMYIDDESKSTTNPYKIKMYRSGKWSMINWIQLRYSCRKTIDETFFKMISVEEDYLKVIDFKKMKKLLKRTCSKKRDVEKKGLGAISIFLSLYGLKAKKNKLYANKFITTESVGFYEMNGYVSDYMFINQISENCYSIKVDQIINSGKKNWFTYFDGIELFKEMDGNVARRYLVNSIYDKSKELFTEFEYTAVLTVDEGSIVDHYLFDLGCVEDVI